MIKGDSRAVGDFERPKCGSSSSSVPAVCGDGACPRLGRKWAPGSLESLVEKGRKERKKDRAAANCCHCMIDFTGRQCLSDNRVNQS